MVAAMTSMRPRSLRTPRSSGRAPRLGELRIQRCAGCGALRHPPGPMCPACGVPSDGGYVVAAGTGEVFSYVVHHHPPVPGKRLPLVVALVQLPEGVRMVGEMPGVRPGPGPHRPAGPGHVRPGRRGPDPARLAARRGHAPGPGHRRDAHLRDLLGAGHPRLPGRAPRPGPRRGPRREGHLPQHLDHHRPGPALRLRLGRPGCGGPGHLDPPRRALPRRRHAHPDRPGHRGRRPEQVVAVTGRCRLGDHVTGTVRIARC